MADAKSGTHHIHFHLAGSGPAVVFLHGWCNDLNYWKPLFRELEKRHTVMAYDARGHGLSCAPHGKTHYRLGGFVKDLKDLLRQLKLPRPLVVGHSLGAATAVAFAAENPGKVSGLVLCSADFGFQPKSKIEDQQVRRAARGWAAFAKRHGLAEWARHQIQSAQVPRFILDSTEHQRAHIERYARQPLQGFDGIAHTLPWWDRKLIPMVRKLSVPSRIIIGDQDSMFFEGARIAAGQLKNAELTIVRGGYHDLARSSPDEFFDAVTQSISSNIW